MKHIHAELMAQYAQDAMNTDKPWGLWEFDLPNGTWVTLGSNPTWGLSIKYRRKPKTIRVGNRDLPEPLRVAPEYEDKYWIANPSEDAVKLLPWNDDSYDRRWLRRGLLHSSREAAEQWRDAFIELAGGEV